MTRRYCTDDCMKYSELTRRITTELHACRSLAALHLAAIVLLASTHVATLVGAEKTDADLRAIRDSFASRRSAMLRQQVENTYPRLTGNADAQLYSWNKLDFALAALFLDVELERANQAVLDVTAKGVEQRNLTGEERFHWIAPLLIRIYELFHSESPHFPGRLTPTAEKAIRHVLWDYCRGRCQMQLWSPDRIWWFWGSENHDAQRLQSLWGATKILSESQEYEGNLLDDENTVAAHYRMINQYVSERFRERVKKGLLVETASPGYSKYTLGCWYNYCDFGDEELSRLAETALTLWWTDWALEEIDTIRGGAKARVYQGEAAQKGQTDCAAAMAWYYLGIGPPRNAHPGLMCLATSQYSLPLVVMDIALDVEGRGNYEYRSRRPGLLDPDKSKIARELDMYALETAGRGLSRYTFCTPDFIMGSWVQQKRPLTEWSAISSQNRWQGVIFAGSDPDARIFPQCMGLRNGKTYNQYWSLQDKGTMIVTKLPGPEYSKQAGDMRVFFASSLKRHEDHGWIFAEAERAYAAVRFTGSNPSYTWDDSDWARSQDSTKPVIIEVASEKDYVDFQAFQDSILAKPCNLSEERLVYGESERLVFSTRGNRLPEINGVPVDPNLTKTFDCPYLRQDYDTGIVTIAKGSRRLILDVTPRK